MRLKFNLHGAVAEFQRNWFTGTAKLVTVDGSTVLQSAANPLTHVSITLQRTWCIEISGATVRIVKTRPLLLAGLRPQRYEVFVGEELVATAAGY